VSTDDKRRASYQFGLTLRLHEASDTLDITLSDVPRHHVSYMFTTTISDIITTTLMEPEDYAVDDDDEDDEDDKE